MSDTIIGSASSQRLVCQAEMDGRKWWVVEKPSDGGWECTSGGYRLKGEAMAEARRQLGLTAS